MDGAAVTVGVAWVVAVAGATGAAAAVEGVAAAGEEATVEAAASPSRVVPGWAAIGVVASARRASQSLDREAAAADGAVVMVAGDGVVSAVGDWVV